MGYRESCEPISGELTWYVVCAFICDWTTGTLTISQESHVDKILERFDMTNIASTPASISTSLRVEKEEETKEDFPYREAVRWLMWLAANTRPGIADTVRAASRYSHDPNAEDWRKVSRILAEQEQGARDSGRTPCL